jgi:hypothetical protein
MSFKHNLDIEKYPYQVAILFWGVDHQSFHMDDRGTLTVRWPIDDWCERMGIRHTFYHVDYGDVGFWESIGKRVGEGHYMVYGFKQKSDAVLFKLTWGGL